MNENMSMDEQFLELLHKITEKNLDNENFSVEELARAAGLSRSMLHRKLMKLTGKSASEFITEKRLTQAKEWLENDVATASETAYRVGFKNPSYFNKVFKKYYGLSPGEIRKNSIINEELPEQKTEKTPFKNSVRVNKYILVAAVAVGLIISGIFIVGKKYLNPEMSIAVLPPDNLTGQEDNDFLAYGVQDELIGELSKLKKLRVISKTSSRAFGDTLMLMKDIARKLNADLMVEASLISAGDSIKILLKVVDVFPRERPVLTTEYKTNMQNMRQIYPSAASDIAQSLHLNLGDDLKKRLSQTRKVNPETLKAYYRGMYYLGKDNEESFETGIRFLREAIDNDPGDPNAYAAMALGYAIKGHHSNTPEEDFTNAGYYADIALDLDSTMDNAYTARAMLNLYQRWEWEKAKEAFNEALERNPNNDVAHANFAWYYVVHGDFKNAVFHGEEAVRINPLYIERNAWLACIYYRNKEYEKAEIYARKVIAERDISVYGNIVMGWISLLKKHYPEAIQYTEKLPKWDYWNLYRAYVYLKAGETEKAFSFRNAMEEKAKTKRVWEWHRGLMAAVFGYNDEAFKYFNMAIDKKQYQMMYLNWYPFTESIRNDPRYNELLRRMNLPPYQVN